MAAALLTARGMARRFVPFLPLTAMFGGLLWREYRHELPDLRDVLLALAVVVAASLLVRRLVESAWATITVGRHRARLDALTAFTATLRDGRHDLPGFYGEGTTAVSGVRRRRRVRLIVHRDQVLLEAWVHHPVASWHLTRPALPDRLLRRALRRPGAGASWRLDAQQGLAPGELEQARVERALRRLFQEHGATSLGLQDGLLRAVLPRRDADFTAERLDAAFGELETVALVFDRREVTVRAARGRTFGWTGGTGALRCPYCRDGISLEDEGLAPCGACLTLHHVDCLDEAGGCTVMGCDGGPRRASARRGRVGA